MRVADRVDGSVVTQHYRNTSRSSLQGDELKSVEEEREVENKA